MELAGEGLTLLLPGGVRLLLPPTALDALAELLHERLSPPSPASSEHASPYMTVPEAAAFLRVRRQRVDDLLSQGRLSRVKEGRRTLVRRSELERHLSP